MEPGWFERQATLAKRNVEQWPQWMKEATTIKCEKCKASKFKCDECFKKDS